MVVWAQREVGKTEERQVMEKVPTQEGWWVESRLRRVCIHDGWLEERQVKEKVPEGWWWRW